MWYTARCIPNDGDLSDIQVEHKAHGHVALQRATVVQPLVAKAFLYAGLDVLADSIR